MAIKLFLDTNIFLDYLLQRKGQLPEIEKIFELAECQAVDIFLSESVLATTIYFLQKEKLDALEIVRELAPYLNFTSLKRDVLFHPLEKYNDLEDGLLYFSAAQAKVDYYITRNKKDYQFTLPSLVVLTPSEFFEQILPDDLP